MSFSGKHASGGWRAQHLDEYGSQYKVNQTRQGDYEHDIPDYNLGSETIPRGGAIDLGGFSNLSLGNTAPQYMQDDTYSYVSDANGDQAHLAGVKGEVTGINETSSLNIPCAEPFYSKHAAALQLTGANTSASQELGENQGTVDLAAAELADSVEGYEAGSNLTAYEQPLSNGSAIPYAAAAPRTHYGSGRRRSHHPYPQFHIFGSDWFVPGLVFKTKWYEPKGRGAITDPRTVNRSDIGEVWEGIRRFIVVAKSTGNSVCVPIYTYSYRACKKDGVKPETHGIIHDERNLPELLDGEPKLGFNPVRARLFEITEMLARESRVDYAKLCTVEHNAAIAMVGYVIPEDFDRIVTPAVDFCWQQRERNAIDFDGIPLPIPMNPSTYQHRQRRKDRHR